MKKVLIVSYYFPPLNNIAAKRYGLMCKYFKQNGYDTYILTTTIKESNGLGICNGLELPLEKKHILRITGKSSNYRKKIKGLLALCDLGEKCKLSFRTISAEGLLWFENVKKELDLKKLDDINLVIGTYGPIGNLYIAKYIAGRLGCPYIIDIRDFISEWQEVEEGFRHCTRIDNIVERKLLSTANGIIAVTPRIKKVVQKKYPGKKTITIFNGWDKTQIEVSNIENEKYLYSAGLLYNHRVESFLVLLRALKEVNEKEHIKLIIRSIGPQKLDKKVKQIVLEMKMENVVFILPPASENVIRKEQSQAYINVVLNSLNEANLGEMGMIPGKSFEYMNERAPILAISPPKSDLAKVLSYTNKGFATISEDEIVNFILHNNQNYIGNNNIKKFTREYQAKKLCRFMDYILQ